MIYQVFFLLGVFDGGAFLLDFVLVLFLLDVEHGVDFLLRRENGIFGELVGPGKGHLLIQHHLFRELVVAEQRFADVVQCKTPTSDVSGFRRETALFNVRKCKCSGVRIKAHRSVSCILIQSYLTVTG